MATQTQTLVVQSKTNDEQPDSGWQKLMPLLDPVVVNAPHVKDAWKKLRRELVFWLANTVAQFPWLNHLALASVIYSESGVAHPSSKMIGLHSFLRWAIPDHYPDVSSLKPVEALIACFGDPPQPRGATACRAYHAVQLHMQDYLQSLPTEERTKLTPFLFPILVNTPQLAQLRGHTERQGQAKRKEQAFAVVKDLHALVAMGRRRYKWLADLDAQVQQIVESVKNQQITLPTVIRCQDLDHRHELTFRVWDRISWSKQHRKAYGASTLSQQRQDSGLFLQLVGTFP